MKKKTWTVRLSPTDTQFLPTIRLFNHLLDPITIMNHINVGYCSYQSRQLGLGLAQLDENNLKSIFASWATARELKLTP